MHHFFVRYVHGGHFSSLWQLWNTKREINVSIVIYLWLMCTFFCLNSPGWSHSCLLVHMFLHSGGFVPQGMGGYKTVIPQWHASSSKPTEEGIGTPERIWAVCNIMTPSCQTYYHEDEVSTWFFFLKGGIAMTHKHSLSAENACRTYWTASRAHSFHGDRAPGSGGGHSWACSRRSGGTCAPHSGQTHRIHHLISSSAVPIISIRLRFW